MSMGIIQILTRSLTGPVPTGISVVMFLAAGAALVFDKQLSVRAKKVLRVIMGIAIIALSTVMLYSSIVPTTHGHPLYAAIYTAFYTLIDLVIARQILRILRLVP